MNVAIVGSGPAGLMAATGFASQGAKVTIFEKRKGPGRKLLIAGSSGLNVTYDAPLEEFIAKYTGPREHFEKVLRAFTPQDWLAFIEKLGLETFKGTSRRYFVREMKASGLLRAWLDRLTKMGVKIEHERECVDFESTGGRRARLTFATGEHWEGDIACLCLGGGSYVEDEKPLRIPELFKRKGLRFNTFKPSNVGFKVDWPQAFIKEFERQPLKNVVLSSSRGSKAGDLMISKTGLEGTPVYYAGIAGEGYLDLKPDLTEEQILARLQSIKENRAPLKKAKKTLKLSPAALALITELASPAILATPEAFAKGVKRFPLILKEPQPLDEAISSAGGLDWSELNDSLMLKKFPGIHAAGELLDWDAPTGGFLIQACVSQGNWVASQVTCRKKEG